MDFHNIPFLFSDVKKEAVAAMNVAIEFQNKGKTEKALKIFQHAVALDPLHADILTAYGEFLEIHVKDVVKADHMYKVALENCPAHGRALENRQRTGNSKACFKPIPTFKCMHECLLFHSISSNIGINI